MLVYYFGMKIAFFFGIVRSFIKFEPLQKHWLFLSLLYTAGVAFLSAIFIGGPAGGLPSGWPVWLGVIFVVSCLYFKALARFDEGIVFFLLLFLGVGFVMFDDRLAYLVSILYRNVVSPA
jgi:hypothetical protein